MDRHARRRHDAQNRSVNVASANRAPIEASPGGTKANADLASEVEAVSRLGAEQSDWRNEMRKAYKLCRELRPRLYYVLKAVVKISVSVVLDKETAEFMKLPRTHNDGKFVDDARAIWNGLAKNRQAFLDAGLAARVFDDLPKLIDGFVEAKSRIQTARERITIIRGEIVDRLGAGDKAIDVIEAILATSAEADPNAVKHFRLAKRVGPSRAKPAASPETPAAATSNPDPTARTA